MKAAGLLFDLLLSGDENVNLAFRFVPSADGRGVEYPARKQTVVTSNNRPICVSCDWRLSSIEIADRYNWYVPVSAGGGRPFSGNVFHVMPF
jgi:hypothetical protein